MSEKQQQKFLDETEKLVQEEKWDAIIAKCNEIIVLPPDSSIEAMACTYRGIAKDEMGDYEGAIADYDRAIEINPQYAKAHNNRGITKDNMGDYKGAIADYDRAIEINPQYAEAYNNRGTTKDSLGDHKGAIADHDRAIKINPQSAKAYNNRGIAKDSLGDYKGAIADYDRAIEINPQSAKAYKNRGIAKDNMGDRKGAIADYDRAIEIDLQYAEAYNNRGTTKGKVGDHASALAGDKHALRIDPGHKNTFRYQDFFHVLQAMKDTLQAMKDALQTMKGKQPPSPPSSAKHKDIDDSTIPDGKVVWWMVGLIVLSFFIFGAIALLGAVMLWCSGDFNTLLILPLIFAGGAMLSPIAWHINMLSHDKNWQWVLREVKKTPEFQELLKAMVAKQSWVPLNTADTIMRWERLR